MRRRLDAAGYQEVKTPQLVDRSLWEKSGHWEKYREHMFLARVDEEDKTLALKPMNCPCHVQIFKQGVRSYRELPLRMAEFGACTPLRAVGRAARDHAGARLHPGRRAHLLRGEGHRPGDRALRGAARQRLPRFRVRHVPGEVRRPPGRARRLRRGLGQGGSGPARGLPPGRGGIRAEPGRGGVLRPEAGVRPARRDRPGLAMRHAAGRLRPAGAAGRRITRPRTAAGGARSCCTGRSWAVSSGSSAS